MTWTMRTPDLSAFWGVIPPPSDDVPPSVSEPFSLGYNFTGNTALVDIDGRTSRRRMQAMTGGANGAERIAWVGLDGPAECISITVSEDLRRQIAQETGAASFPDLADIYSESDPVFSALAFRLRAAGRAGWTMDALELDSIVRGTLRHFAVSTFGGRLPPQGRERIDPVRLARVADYLDAHIGRHVLLDDLADVAAMSPFHFQRAFRHTTGLTPHAFQTAMRMDRAASLIRAGATRSAAAHAVGYSPGHGFRRALRRFAGL